METNSKESLIIELSSSSGYSPEIVELLYDFTDGDKERIQKIISSLNTNILIVKANAESKAIDKKAFFYFAYDMGKSEYLEKGFFAYNRFEEVDLKADWDDLKQIIFSLKSENKFDGRMWAFFEREIQHSLFMRELKKITSDFLNTNKFKTLLESALGKALPPVFYNKNFNFDLEFLFIDPLTFYQPVEKKEKKEEEETEEDKKEDSLIRIKVYPLLDPIHGKNVRDLQADDEVLFELRDEREAAHYISELLEEKNSDQLVGTVRSFTTIDQDTIKLDINFAPGIFGESIIVKTLLLKIAHKAQSLEEKEGEENKLKSFSLKYKSFLIGVFVIMFITILIILLN